MIIDKESGKFLSIKRSGIKELNRDIKWDLPGGNLDQNDLPEHTVKVSSGDNEILMKAIKREILEETGLIIDRPIFLFFISGYKEKSNKLTLGFVYAGFTNRSDSVTLSPEHSEYGWFEKDQILKLDFGDSWTSLILNQLFSKVETMGLIYHE